MRIFSTVRSGLAKLYRVDGSSVVYISRENSCLGYSALEFAVHQTDERQFNNPLSLLLHTFLNAERELGRGGVIAYDGVDILRIRIASRARLEAGLIRYNVVVKDAKEVASILNDGATYFPDDWNFSWGGKEKISAFYTSLLAICYCHICSIHFGAIRHSLRGAGIDQLCLKIEHKKLVRLIKHISGLSNEEVIGILKVFTNGYMMEHPDPALQPILPIGKDLYCLPCIFILSSNWPRNVLSLQSRIDRNLFDSQSYRFERMMISRLTQHREGRFRILPNKIVSREEMDAIILDADKKQMLICELKWTIQPGDAREVIRRADEALRKVKQLRRKLNFVSANLTELSRAIDTEIDESWSIRGIVLIEGYGGRVSSEPNEIPIVPFAIFDKALFRNIDLEKIHAIFCSSIWLPRMDIDYIFHSDVEDLCGFDFSLDKIIKIDPAYIETRLDQYFTEALSLSDASLRRTDWPVYLASERTAKDSS